MPRFRAGGKSEIPRVADQRDASPPRQRIERRKQPGLRRGVIDHDQPAWPRQTGEHAIETGERVGRPAMHRHHDVDRGPQARRRRDMRGGRDSKLGTRIERTAQQVLAVTTAHVQQPGQTLQRVRRHGEAARPCQQAAIIDPHPGVGRRDTDLPASLRPADGQHRIEPGIAGMPRPARQATITTAYTSNSCGDRRNVERAAQKLAPIGSHNTQPSPCGRGLGGGGRGAASLPSTAQ